MKQNNSKIIIRTKDNKTFNKIEQLVQDFLNVVPGINLFDNYNHRTVRIETIIRELWPDFILNTSRNKEDARCKSLSLEKIEVKTKNYKDFNSKESTMFKSKFMFDKQDRESRRDYILKFDGLAFAVFIKEKLHWLSWTNDINTLSEYRKICVKKQEEFLVYWEEKQKRRDQNGGNDAITISLNEFSDSSIWNFYYEGNIHTNITIKEIKEILKII